MYAHFYLANIIENTTSGGQCLSFQLNGIR